MTAWEKCLTAIWTLVLLVSMTVAFFAFAVLLSGCVHAAQPPIPPSPEMEPYRVVLPATAENEWLFCVEDPFITGTFEHPAIRTGLSCPWTVQDVRRMVARLRLAD